MVARAPEIQILRLATWNRCPEILNYARENGIQLQFHGLAQSEVDTRPFKQVHQVHGTSIVDATEANLANCKADGIVTSERELELAIKTADCLPVMIHTEEKVAALHCGWRSLCGGIIGELPHYFSERQLEKAQVFFGPAISRESFEVGYEVIEAASSVLGPAELLASTSKGIKDRWHFDLRAAAIFQCVKTGIDPKNIRVATDCTKTDSGNWHSYRRNGPKAGRNWTTIQL